MYPCAVFYFDHLLATLSGA